MIKYSQQATGRKFDIITHFLEEDLFDSLGFILFVSFIENEFGITISEDELDLDNLEIFEVY